MIDKELLIAQLEETMRYHNIKHDFPWNTKKKNHFHYTCAKALSDAIVVLKQC